MAAGGFLRGAAHPTRSDFPYRGKSGKFGFGRMLRGGYHGGFDSDMGRREGSYGNALSKYYGPGMKSMLDTPEAFYHPKYGKAISVLKYSFTDGDKKEKKDYDERDIYVTDEVWNDAVELKNLYESGYSDP